MQFGRDKCSYIYIEREKQVSLDEKFISPWDWAKLVSNREQNMFYTKN